MKALAASLASTVDSKVAAGVAGEKARIDGALAEEVKKLTDRLDGINKLVSVVAATEQINLNLAVLQFPLFSQHCKPTPCQTCSVGAGGGGGVWHCIGGLCLLRDGMGKVPEMPRL